jgi:hypothetical protein
VSDGPINEAEYRRVFAAFEQERPDSLIVSDAAVHATNPGDIPINQVTSYELAINLNELPAFPVTSPFLAGDTFHSNNSNVPCSTGAHQLEADTSSSNDV